MTHTTPVRHRTRLVLALVASALVVPGLLAGCTPEASSDAAASATASSGNESARLGQCLRDAGYDVDDPDLRQGVVVAPPEGADPQAYSDAFDACAAQIGGSLADLADGPSPADVAKAQRANLEVARCVREKGFDDFPDPVDGYFDIPMSTGDPSPRDEAFYACDAEFGLYAGTPDSADEK